MCDLVARIAAVLAHLHLMRSCRCLHAGLWLVTTGGGCFDFLDGFFDVFVALDVS